MLDPGQIIAACYDPVASGLRVFGGSQESNFFRQHGTSPVERWYGAGIAAGTDLGTFSTTVNVLRAIPFFAPRGGTLDKLSFNVTASGSAGSKARVGIYRATSHTNLYPSSLVVDGGEIATITNGVKTSSISVALTPGELYYFAVLTGTSAPTLRAVTAPSAFPLLGIDTSMGTALGTFWTVSLAYAALPASFPGAATVGTGSFPLIAAHLV